MNKDRYGGIVVDTLIVVVAIALLTAIAVPVYKNQDQKAKLEQAQHEIAQLADAQMAVARRYGFYVPLQMLDDLPVIEASRSERTDDIGNEPGSIRLIDAITSGGEQPTLQSENDRVRELREKWSGPFFQAKRVHMPTSDESAHASKLETAAIARDYPLDPWGNPYRFYSPFGIVGTQAASDDPAALNSETFSDGVINPDEDRFDSYAIVSFGPDGKSATAVSDPAVENDDIIFMFGQ